MTIEQTVEIPANHRLTIDVPHEVPSGPVVLTFTPAPAASAVPPRKMTPAEAVEYCWGLGKRLGSCVTSDRIIEMRREDKALEEAKYRRLYGTGGNV